LPQQGPNVINYNWQSWLDQPKPPKPASLHRTAHDVRRTIASCEPLPQPHPTAAILEQVTSPVSLSSESVDQGSIWSQVIRHRRLVRLVYLGEAGFLFLISAGMAVGVLRDGHEFLHFSYGNRSLLLIGIVWSALAILFFMAGCRLTKKAMKPECW